MRDNKKILITGINGFIGSHLGSGFTNKQNLYGLDTGAVCSVPGIHNYYQMILPNTDFEDLIKSICPDYCIHCAGSASVPLSVEHPSIDFDAGPITIFYIQDAIRKSRISCTTILFSSAAVYGNPRNLPVSEESPLNPVSPYGYHKVMSEIILKEFYAIYGLPYIILRIFSAYGNGLKKQLLWDACQKIITKDSLFWGTGEETRDFIHIDDIVKIVKLCIEKNVENKILNLGSGIQVSIKTLIHSIAECIGYPSDQIRFKGKIRDGDPLNWEADISLIRSLGFTSTVTLDKGVKEYVRWVQDLPSI
jgi:UDP-glucose 4-epimerase